MTAALPGATIVGASRLGSDERGGVESALVELADGRRLVVRVAEDDEAGRAVRTEARVLEALSAGVRSLLPFAAPRILGQTALGTGHAVVSDYLDGYRVDAADIPPGAGFAGLIGRALAAVHDLPVTVIRAEGFPVRSADQVRTDTARLIDRADASGRLPRELRDRWRSLVDDDAAWRFEATVVLDGFEITSLVFDDVAETPAVVGLLGWQGLSIGDPAVDLRWLGSAPAAADAVHEAYASSSHRASDTALLSRARLFAELEFAKWLVHGVDTDDAVVVSDAEKLLASLADATDGTELVRHGKSDVDDAIALLEQVPAATDSPIDTSMQTDAYDPVALGAYLADVAPERPDPDEGGVPTLPVDLSEWTAAPTPAHEETSPTAEDDEESRAETARASREALRRWTEG